MQYCDSIAAMRGFLKAVVLVGPVLAAAFAVPPPAEVGRLDIEEIDNEFSPSDEPFTTREFIPCTCRCCLLTNLFPASGGILMPVDLPSSFISPEEDPRLVLTTVPNSVYKY